MRLIGPPPAPPGALAPAPPAAAAGLGGGARLWLARHAEVAREHHDRAYGALDVPLSPSGEADTLALARAFEGAGLRAVYSSDLARALALGRALAEASGAPLVVTPALREIDRGHWTGILRGEFQARWAAAAAEYWRDPWSWSAPGGESEALLFERAWPAILGALEDAAGGTAVVAAHANLIRIVAGRALGLTPPESYRLELRPAHAGLLIDDPSGWRMSSWNVDRPE